MNQPSLRSPGYCILLCYSICISILFYALIPLLTQYTTVDLNLSLAVAGILSGLFSIVSLAARPLSGYLSDSWNPARLFRYSTTGLGISIILIMPVQSFPLLLILRAFQGILYAFSSTACFVLINRQIPISRLNEGIGYYGMGQILSSSIGMSLGIFLTGHFTLSVCWLLLGLSLLLVAAAHIFMSVRWFRHGSGRPVPDQPIPGEPILKRPAPGSRLCLPRPKLHPASLIPMISPCLLGALFSVSNGVETTLLALIGNERGVEHISLFFTLYVIILVLSRPFTGRLCDVFGLKAVLYPALLLMVAESFLIGTAGALLPLLLAAVCKALGQGSAHPSLQAECIRRMGYGKSGTASSIFLLFTDLGQGLGPMFAGYLAGFMPFQSIFYGLSLLYLTAFLLCYIIIIPSKPGQPQPDN